jgi:hypothetical protein
MSKKQQQFTIFTLKLHLMIMYAKTCKTDVIVFIYNIIQLMTFHKVDTVIYQPRGSNVHRSQWLR